MREWAEALVERARAEGVSVTGEGGLLTALMGQVLQTGLEVETRPGGQRKFPERRLHEGGERRDRPGGAAYAQRSGPDFRAGHGPQAFPPIGRG